MGLLPTSGRLGDAGVLELSSTLDTVGPIAATVGDLALTWQALSGTVGPPAFPTPGPSSGSRRVGIVRSDLTGRLVAEQTGALEHAVDVVRAAGAGVRDLPLPEFDDCVEPYLHIQGAEAYALHRHRVESAPEKFDDEVLDRLTAASQVAGWQYVAAVRRREQLRERMLDRMFGLDLLVHATVPITAPRLGSRGEPLGAGWEQPREALLAPTAPWTLVGFPALTVPIPAGPGSLPAAVQLVA